ncbi:MAG: helix-turn-helix domain-containing protein [Pseudomonadota bacterium]
MPDVDIVLTDRFPVLSLTLVTEPLRVANRESAEQVWRWRLLSAEGGPKVSSSGIPIDTQELDETPADIVLLLASYQPETALAKPLLTWLKRRARSGTLLGCVDSAALIFAKAGLLSGSPAAVHFEALSSYRALFHEEIFVDRLFSVTERRCSSAGGVATMDMTLGLIERFSGAALAARVAEVLTYRPTQHSGPQQKLLIGTAIKRLDRTLARALDLMIATLDQPLPIGALAERVGVPVWTLTRLFKHHLKETPAAYYRQLRLMEARNLLRNSSLRVSEIAGLCGFDNPESFARAYRRQFGMTASQDRENPLSG